MRSKLPILIGIILGISIGWVCMELDKKDREILMYKNVITRIQSEHFECLVREVGR